LDQLIYIVAACGLAAVVSGTFAVNAWLRLGRARRRLMAIDRRESRR
jgi:hypothetical protein